MALYVTICVLAALLALPEDEPQGRTLQIIWGVTIGLALAHWFAFRLSARLVGAGHIRAQDVASGGAQLVGAVAVAGLASIPVLLFPKSAELEVAEFVLGGFLGVVGYAVGRSAGATRTRAVLYAASVLVVALAIAAVKNALAGGH